MLILVALLLGHALLIYWMAGLDNAPRLVPEAGFSALPVYVMPWVAPELEPPQTRVEQPDPEPRPLPEETSAITLPEPSPVPAGERRTRTDWANEAAEVARQTARPGPRQFGELPKEEAPEEKAPLGIFERGPKHRAGDIEMLGRGVERRWVSPYCYIDFGHTPMLFAESGRKVNPVRCNLPSEGRGDLFDHLKPEYLEETTE